MKVLIVHPQMAINGGAEVVISKLAHYLKAHGHGVSILTLTTANHPDYQGLDFILPDNEKDRIQYQLRSGSLSTLKEIIQIYLVLKNLVAKHINDYDIVNPHNFPSIWACSGNKPIVQQVNEIPDLWHNQRIPRLVNPFLNIGRLGDRLITDSKHPIAVVADGKMAKLFEHRYLIKPEIVPYGIDSEFFGTEVSEESKLHLRYLYRLNSDDFIIIQPSMISPSKRQMTVLGAVKILKDKIPNLKVVFAGYKEDVNDYTIQLMDYVEVNKLQKNVVFTGMVNRETLRTLYSLSNIAVFPGRGQGSWLGGFEALSTGTPIIVSPNLTCSELVQKEELGIVSDNVTESINTIYGNYSYYKDRVRTQKEYVVNNLTWDKYSESLMRLMESHLA